jgi:hypothetical protein
MEKYRKRKTNYVAWKETGKGEEIQVDKNRY